jgi:Helix-turn-helix domain
MLNHASVPYHQPHAQAPLRQAASIQGRPHTYRLDNAFIDDWGERIGAHAIAVYNVLARHADRQTGESYPAIPTIARKTRLSPTTVKKALRLLKRHHLIDWQPRVDAAGDPASHLYTVGHAADAWRHAGAGEGGGSTADGPPAPAAPGSITACQGSGAPADAEQGSEQGFRTSAQSFSIAQEEKTPQRCTGPHDWHRLGDYTHCCKHCEAHHDDCRCFNCRLSDTPTAPEAALPISEPAPEAAPSAPEPQVTPEPAQRAARSQAQGQTQQPISHSLGAQVDDLLRQYATVANSEVETPAVVWPACPAEA